MNNIIILQGVVSSVEDDFDAFDRKYRKFKMATIRNSGTMDILNCETYSEQPISNGDYIRVVGQVRCRGTLVDGKIKCKMYVACDEIRAVSQWNDVDSVYLSGVLSKVSNLRLTPLTHREIVEFVIRVNNSSTIEYVHCVAWGRGARKIASKKRGDKVSFVGRFQSRDYMKRLENGKEELRTAYEVSCHYVLKEGKGNEIETVQYDSGKLYVLRKRTV